MKGVNVFYPSGEIDAVYTALTRKEGDNNWMTIHQITTVLLDMGCHRATDTQVQTVIRDLASGGTRADVKQGYRGHKIINVSTDFLAELKANLEKPKPKQRRIYYQRDKPQGA